jgi:hypothetical protein
MKGCDNSTRKIHISNNFILSISLLIMFDTSLPRPSLHCSTPLHFTTLHLTTLHYTSLHFTSLIYTSLPFHLALRIYISYGSISLYITSHYITSRHITRHSTDLIPKIISKIIKYFTALKNFSPFHFTSLHFTFYFILFIYLFTRPINHTHHFTFLFLTTTYSPSPHFTSLQFLSPSLPLTGLHFPNPRFENMRFTLGGPYRPFR